jgi:REP element-mobilizing transposase RayT
MLHRKSSRLPPQNYLGHGIYFLAICCDHRHPHLAGPSIATDVRTLLFQSAAANTFSSHAYCLMPDHVHILTEGIHPTADALEFVRHCKQLTAFQFKLKTQRTLWEFSYYDHILSPKDRIIEVARYIWWNPVRKNLCASPGDYPFSGSQTFTWMQDSPVRLAWCAPWQQKKSEKARV